MARRQGATRPLIDGGLWTRYRALTSDLLAEFDAAPVTDRAPIPDSLPPEDVDSMDLEVRMDFASEPSAEVSIPSPRRIQRAPSMGPEEATAQLDMSRIRGVDDRADTALEPQLGSGARPVPPRKEATMVVRDRGPKSRPEPGGSQKPPPAPKPSDSPPPPGPPNGPSTPSAPAAPRGLEPLEALEAIAARSAPALAPRRSSSVGPLPKRPAVERSSHPASEPAPARRRPPRDPTGR